MGKKLHKRMSGEEVKIHQHDNYQMPGAYKQDGDKNQNQPMFKMGKPYEMGMSMRGPLDKHGKVLPNSWEEEDVKRGRKEMAEGHYKHGKALFDDAHGSWNWSKSHHSTGAEPKMRGPLNQTQQSAFIEVSEEEFKKRSAKRAKEKAAKQVTAEGGAEATAEGAGQVGKNQQLKTNMERKITQKVKQ